MENGIEENLIPVKILLKDDGSCRSISIIMSFLLKNYNTTSPMSLAKKYNLIYSYLPKKLLNDKVFSYYAKSINQVSEDECNKMIQYNGY